MELPIVRHFLVCLQMGYDWTEPSGPYCLENVLFGPSLPAGVTFPAAAIDLWIFATIEGIDQHELWIDLALHADEPGEEREGDDLATYGPFLVTFEGSEATAIQRGWHLRCVPLPRSGWYEFRLSTQGEIIASESILMEG